MSGVPSAFQINATTMNHGGRIALLGIPPSDMAEIDWTKVIFKGLVIKGIYGRLKCSKLGTRWQRPDQSGLICHQSSLTTTRLMISKRLLNAMRIDGLQ